MNFINIKTLKQLTTHPLISGSAVMFIGSFLMSIGNYVYNLLMGRMLSVSDYGLLTSLSAFVVLCGLFSSSFTNIFVKFSAGYKGANDEAGLQNLFYYSLRVLGISGIAFALILIGLIPFLKSFLHVDNTEYLFLLIVTILVTFFLTLPQGILQGRLQFISLSASNIAQPIIKIILALSLLSIGFGLTGPFTALAASVLIPTIILYVYYVGHFRSKKHQAFDTEKFRGEFFKLVYVFLFAGIGTALLSNTDIMLVRYFFSETVSGQYAALSLMGKAIFYLIMPINYAFFPLIAYKRERKERLFNTVLLATGVTLLATVALSFIYFAFPSVILRIFFPAPEYQVVGKYLGFYSLYIMVFSLATLFSSFFLSLGKTAVYKISLGAAALQIVLIFLFHNSLYQVIGSLFMASLVFFVILLGYYVKHGKD